MKLKKLPLSIESWHDINKMSTEQVEQTLRQLQKGASQQLKSATEHQKKLKPFKSLERLLWRPKQRDNETKGQYRARMINQISQIQKRMRAQTITRAGMYQWQANMDAAIERLTGQKVHLTLEEYETLGEILEDIKSKTKLYTYLSSDERLVEGFKIFMQGKEHDLSIADLKDLINNELERRYRDEVANRGPATGITISPDLLGDL